MEFNNLKISDVVLHEVFRRSHENKTPPEYGKNAEKLDEDALDALRDRINTAMTSSTRAVEMAIKTPVQGCMLNLVKDINVASSTYISFTRQVADKLADEQKSKSIPGGIVVSFKGVVGVPSRRLVGVIKAEVHNGFLREKNAGGTSLKFLKTLMLTAQTKLYKVSLFVESLVNAEEKSEFGWNAYIYDDTLTASNKYGAAKYFYDGFLGLEFPASSARETGNFHTYTKDFISDMNLPQEAKIEMHNALVAYLKTDQTPTVSVSDFSDKYFDSSETKDAYAAYMSKKGFSKNAVNKDISDIAKKLRLRSISMGKIKLTAPAEDFESKITIKVETDDGAKSDQVRTIITVRGKITGQD